MNDSHWLLDNDDAESGYRARMILLRDEGYTVPEIRKITNHHDNNIRKWIHRFNDDGIDGIIFRKHIRNTHKITGKSSVITNVITPSSKSLIQIF